MQLSGVCLSVPANDIDRLLHGAERSTRRANAGSATLSAYVGVEHRLVFNFGDLYYPDTEN